MKILSLLFTSLLLLTLPACVTTRAELNEKRAQEAGKSADQNSSGVQSEELNSKPAVEPAPIASQYGLEEMRVELSKLTGKIEELEQEKKNQQSAQSEEQKKLQARVDELEKKLKENNEKAAGPTVPEGKNAFQAGKDAYLAKEFENATHFFDAYLKENESGKEAEEAIFLRGESYFNLKQYKTAIVDYSKFPERFTKSKFHPKALLKIAESFDALGMKDDAKAFYQDLIEKFPKTVEGKIAKKKVSGKTTKK